MTDSRQTKSTIASLVESPVRMFASPTAVQVVSDSVSVWGTVLLGLFQFFKNVSIVARRLALCPIYDNRLGLPPITWNL